MLHIINHLCIINNMFQRNSKQLKIVQIISKPKIKLSMILPSTNIKSTTKCPLCSNGCHCKYCICCH